MYAVAYSIALNSSNNIGILIFFSKCSPSSLFPMAECQCIRLIPYIKWSDSSFNRNCSMQGLNAILQNQDVNPGNLTLDIPESMFFTPAAPLPYRSLCM
jgi:hypothetical protein